MNPWEDASSWEGDGLRREVFFFTSGDQRLYASLYAAIEPRLDVRLVMCTGWGHDMLQLNDLEHDIALGLSLAGGAALVFHPPGHGDSPGSMQDLTVQRHVSAAIDAAAEGARRLGTDGWDFSGIRIGASVAVLAATAAGGRLLPLIHPALDLPAHFAELRRRARRLALGREGDPMLFGHPLPERAETELPGRSPLEVLAGFPGTAAAIHFTNASTEALPDNVEDIVVPGKLSTPPGPREQGTLAQATVRWITSSAMAGVAP